MNKRRFITGVLTAGVAALSSRTVLALAMHRIAAVVHDERYSDAREFARALAARGVSAFAAAQDPVALWYDRLQPRVAATSGRLAGLTPQSDLALLRQCAAELGLALLYEGVHDCRGVSWVTHSLRARGGFADADAAAVRGAGRRWPSALATALQAAVLAGAWEPPLEARHSAPRAADHPGTLVSWVIGPA